MSHLTKFSQQERTQIVSLVYKAGLWVSSSDSDGGQYADTEEFLALEETIKHMTRGMFESAFIHEVMAEVFLRKAEWPEWAKQTSSVLEECHHVIRLLREKEIAVKDVDAYRRIIMQVGLEVARAFREYDKNEPVHYKIIRKIGILVDRFFGALQGEKYASEDLLNVSYKEDLALNKLASALRGETGQADIITNS